MMFWGNHMGFGVWGMLFGGLAWIALIALGIWLLARLFPAGGNSRESERPENRETPLQILQRRYARGEITKEEYETIRHDLAS